jgi:hypothetical protein
MNRRVRLIALAALVAGFGCSVPVSADDALNGGTVAAPTLASPAADAAAAPVSAAAAATEPPATPTTATTPVPPPAATASGGSADLAPGPMLAERKVLLGHIKQASAGGIGTANYMMAFNAVEDQVRAGASEAQIRPRVESLSSSLVDQLKRSQLLKVQRPLPPSASQQGDAAGAPIAAAGTGGGKAGGMNPAIVDKIKSQLGGIDIPDSLRDKLLNNDKARELLKKFGQ